MRKIFIAILLLTIFVSAFAQEQKSDCQRWVGDWTGNWSNGNVGQSRLVVISAKNISSNECEISFTYSDMEKSYQAVSKDNVFQAENIQSSRGYGSIRVNLKDEETIEMNHWGRGTNFTTLKRKIS